MKKFLKNHKEEDAEPVVRMNINDIDFSKPRAEKLIDNLLLDGPSVSFSTPP